MKKLNQLYNSLTFFIPSAFLLIISIYLSGTGSKVFYSTDTFGQSGVALTSDWPPDASFMILRDNFIKFFKYFLRDYVIPAYIFLLPAIWLAAAALTRLKKNIAFPIEKIKSKIPYFLFICTLLFVLYVHFVVLKGFPNLTDEFAYLFQAKLLTQGRLYADSPAHYEFFQVKNVVNNGKWYGKYTLGWPFMLAAGMLLKMGFIIGPLCAAFSAVLIYLIAERFISPAGGIIASLIVIMSPFFIMLGGTYLLHTAAGLFLLLYIYYLSKSFDSGNLINPVIAGASIGFLFIIRPVEGGLIFLGMIPWIIYKALRSNSFKDCALKLTLIIIFIPVAFAVLAVVNIIQNGHPFLFGYQVYYPEEKWGFRNFDHDLLKGLWNVTFSLMRLSVWVVPFIIILLFFSISRKNLETALLLVPPVFFCLFYLGWYGLGSVEIGSRFYYPAFIVVSIPAAAGFFQIQNILEEKKWAISGSIAPAFLILITLYSVFGLFVPHFTTFTYFNQVLLDRWHYLQNPSGVQGSAVIFLQGFSPSKNYMYTRNMPEYRTSKNIYVLYLSPEENESLIKSYPGRKPYNAFYDNQSGSFQVYPANNSRSALNYYFAALNYQTGVKNFKKAEAAFKKALSFPDSNPEVALSLARLYIEYKKYDKAVPILESLVKINEYQWAYYLLGNCYKNLGKTKEAIDAYNIASTCASNPETCRKAVLWARYLRKKFFTSLE